MLAVATLVGGLIVAKDMKPVADIYMEEFQISKELRKAEDARMELQLDLDDADFALKKAKEAGKSTTSAESSLKRLRLKWPNAKKRLLKFTVGFSRSIPGLRRCARSTKMIRTMLPMRLITAMASIWLA